MTVAVTGSTGHVGANLVRTLLNEGEQVRAIVRENTEPLKDLELEVVKADVLDKASLVEAFKDVETVFHLAGRISILESDEELLQKVNVQGTQNVTEACLECGVKRLVYTSSIEALMVPGGPDPITENAPVETSKLLSAYSRSKYLASLEVLKAVEKGLDAVIVHPTAVVGPHDYKPSLFGQAILDFTMQKLPGFVPGGFDFVDVRDLAAGILAAAQKGKKGERYLLSGSFLSMKDLSAVLEKCSGIRGPRLTIPFWMTLPASLFTPLYYRLSRARPRFTLQSMRMLKDCRKVSCDKAKEELGYDPQPGERGVEAAVEWFREAGKTYPVFKSKHDPGIVIFVLVFILLCVAGGIFQLATGSGIDLLVGIGALLVGFVYAWLNLPVRYELTPEHLLVRGGAFRWKIPYDQIIAAHTSKNPMSAPAWSWKRLVIKFKKKGKNRFVLVSPVDREAFLQKLADASPGLELDEFGVKRSGKDGAASERETRPEAAGDTKEDSA